MNKKTFIIILIISYLATFFRFYIDNNFIVSFIGSFLYGFIIERTLSNPKKEILLTGFCSCFTSFSGFIYFLYQLITKGYYLKLFIYLNLVVIFNLMIMYIGFLISRKVSKF